MSIPWGSARPCSALETSHFYIHFIFLHIGGKKATTRRIIPLLSEEKAVFQLCKEQIPVRRKSSSSAQVVWTAQAQEIRKLLLLSIRLQKYRIF